jgi:hypothetical protein
VSDKEYLHSAILRELCSLQSQIITLRCLRQKVAGEPTAAIPKDAEPPEGSLATVLQQLPGSLSESREEVRLITNDLEELLFG